MYRSLEKLYPSLIYCSKQTLTQKQVNKKLYSTLISPPLNFSKFLEPKVKPANT